MIACTSCKSSNAVLILTSIQCPNPDCIHYDEDWAKEIIKKKTGRTIRNAKRYSKKKISEYIPTMPW